MKKKIFAIGAGGSGMSGLIRLLRHQEHEVRGSDSGESENTQALKKEGVRIWKKHEAKHITKNLDEVIYSQAISEENPERAEAKKKNIPQLSYPEALGKYTNSKTRICVAGTHGKTTTSAMIAVCLLKAKKDPTVIIGSSLKELGKKNERIGKSKYAVLEACEYKESFLNIPANILILTNIELDHVDYFKNEKKYLSAFEKYIKMVPKDGVIIYLKGEKNIEKLLKKTNGPKKIAVCIDPKIKLMIPGEHNRKNASLALALGEYLGISKEILKKTLAKFSGTKRRLEYKGAYGKTKIYDDYGHHPTEIKATLQALRELYPKEKILTVFQPHQYSRTKALLSEFATAFSKTNSVIIPNIFEARDNEKDKKSVSVEELITKVQKHHKSAINGEGIQNTIHLLKKTAKNYDIVITMGAGDVNTIAKALT